jgi:hypothetical protein
VSVVEVATETEAMGLGEVGPLIAPGEAAGQTHTVGECAHRAEGTEIGERRRVKPGVRRLDQQHVVVEREIVSDESGGGVSRGECDELVETTENVAEVFADCASAFERDTVDSFGARVDSSARSGTDDGVEGGVVTKLMRYYAEFFVEHLHLLLPLAKPRCELDDAGLGGVNEWESEVGETGSLCVDEEEHWVSPLWIKREVPHAACGRS